MAYATEIKATADVGLESIADMIGAVCFFAAVTVIVVFIVIRRHKERMELIRRGINPNIQAPANPGGKALFWGLVFSAVGLALLILAVVTWRNNEALGFGLACAFGGGAMLLYWRLTAQQRIDAKEYHRELMAKYMLVPEAGPDKVETHSGGEQST